MINRRFKGVDFEEVYDLEFDDDDMLQERVLRNDYSQLYSLQDISKWVEYGLRKGVIKRSNKKEDVEMIMKWIDLLNKKKIAL